MFMVFIIVIFAGCAAKSTEYVSDMRNGEASVSYDTAPTYYDEQKSVDSSAYTNSVSSTVTGEKKIVKYGSLTIEVTDYNEAYSDLEALLGDSGYLESSNIWKTPRYVNGEKIMLTNANLVIRITEDRFESFVKELENIGFIVNQSTNSDDISYMYYDTDARIKLKEDEKARLEQYLNEIEDAKVYFEIQSRITDVIYEIEQLKGSIQRWDNQVSYATVSITMNEIAPDEEPSVTEPKGFFGKIWENLVNGVEFLGEAIIVIAGAIPVLIIIAVVIILIVKLATRKKKEK